MIMGNMNNRPIGPISQSIEDLEALTPNHFLRSQQYVPLAPNASEDQLVRAWSYAKTQEQKFWKIFVDELVPLLDKRPKWIKERTQPKLGQMVLCLDKTLIPMVWNKARVSEIIIGRDGLARSVILRFIINGKTSFKERSVADIYPLFPEDI